MRNYVSLALAVLMTAVAFLLPQPTHATPLISVSKSLVPLTQVQLNPVMKSDDLVVLARHGGSSGKKGVHKRVHKRIHKRIHKRVHKRMHKRMHKRVHKKMHRHMKKKMHSRVHKKFRKKFKRRTGHFKKRHYSKKRHHYKKKHRRHAKHHHKKKHKMRRKKRKKKVMKKITITPTGGKQEWYCDNLDRDVLEDREKYPECFEYTRTRETHTSLHQRLK
jgi:hypothetical protein